MSNKQQYDVIVIGGGASGLMAAGKAGSRGLSVLVLEKNTVVGNHRRWPM
jgi:flavin-dependent dehydrogenase